MLDVRILLAFHRSDCLVAFLRRLLHGPCFLIHMVVSLSRGPQHRASNTIILAMGTPKNGTLYLLEPPHLISKVAAMSRIFQVNFRNNRVFFFVFILCSRFCRPEAQGKGPTPLTRAVCEPCMRYSPGHYPEALEPKH